MTKSYEFNWQRHLPEFMQEGAAFDRFDEVRKNEKKLHFSKSNRIQKAMSTSKNGTRSLSLGCVGKQPLIHYSLLVSATIIRLFYFN